MHFLNRSKTSWVYHVKRLFESTDDLIKELSLDKPTTRHTIKMFGKDVLIPRFQQAYGKSYTYSGTEAISVPFTEVLDEVKIVVMDVVDEDLKEILKDPSLYAYNMCLVNWYDNGDHHISPHSDDERQLISGSTIASVSLGSTRKFVLAPKKDIEGAVALKLDLEDGDLIIMGGTTQKTHVHSVPKDPKCDSLRINITFRVFA